MVNLINRLALIKAEENILIKICSSNKFVTEWGLNKNVKLELSMRIGCKGKVKLLIAQGI
jgi:hypothetical protein